MASYRDSFTLFSISLFRLLKAVSVGGIAWSREPRTVQHHIHCTCKGSLFSSEVDGWRCIHMVVPHCILRQAVLGKWCDCLTDEECPHLDTFHPYMRCSFVYVFPEAPGDTRLKIRKWYTFLICIRYGACQLDTVTPNIRSASFLYHIGDLRMHWT
jgi:hypothetical protein